MRPRLRASSTLARTQKRVRNRTGIPVRALLGDGSGNPLNMPTRNIAGDTSHYGQVPIRLLSAGVDANGQLLPSPVRQAYVIGGAFPMVDNMPIWVNRLPNSASDEYYIMGVDAQALAQAGVNSVEFNALDPRHKLLWFRNILNAQPIAISDPDSPSSSITSHPYLMIVNGAVQNIGKGVADALDITSSIPSTTGKERLCLIYYATDTDALGVVNGTERDISGDKWELADLNVMIALLDLTTDVPLYTYRLYQGMGVVSERDKLHDLRQTITIPPSAQSTGEASLYSAYASKTADYTLLSTDGTIGVDASGGAITITLLSAVGLAGRSYNIKALDVSGGNITINTTSSQTIDGALTQTLNTQWDNITVQSTGTNWIII